jgi:hypothetical protein
VTTFRFIAAEGFSPRAHPSIFAVVQPFWEDQMLKVAFTALALAVSAGLALPAAAADTAPKAADTMPKTADTAPKAKATKPRAHHTRAYKSCYDYAWDSQDQKDCLAKHPDGNIGGAMKSGAKKSGMKNTGKTSG